MRRTSLRESLNQGTDVAYRWVRRTALAFFTIAALVGSAYYLWAEGLSSTTLFGCALTLCLLLLLIFDRSGQAWASAGVVVILVLFVAVFTPAPYDSERLTLTVFLPSVLALLIAPAWLILASFVVCYCSLALQSSSSSIYYDPGTILLSGTLVVLMMLARLLTDGALRLAARRAAVIEEERRNLEERVAERTAALQQANRELREANSLKDSFLASVSHELRTPLNIVLGNIEMLRDEVYGPTSPRQQQALETASESGEHLLSLITDLLDFSKMSSGYFEIELEPLDLNQLCRQCAQLITPRAEAHGLALRLDLAPDLPLVEGDARRLKQVLINLLDNAVKFTPQGEVGLRTRLVAAAETAGPGAFVELEIWDTGIGIAESDLGRLFRPFHQIDHGLNRRYDGTGLGLALVEQIVKLHEGQVRVESTLGRGSSFVVQLALLR